MQHVGIICEYNPFHAGHAYLLRQVREAQTVVCLMSGNFTQRGSAAVLPPHARAELALRSGADLVLELPFPYAAASARYFATAGIRALKGIGIDTLAFGSETADRTQLLAAAEKTRSAEFEERVAQAMRDTGDAKAYFDALFDTRLGPNDILALEYTRAILEEKAKMEILPVKRIGARYHDKKTDSPYPSATALREKLARGEDITDDFAEELRDAWRRLLEKNVGFASTSCLGNAVLARLRAESEYAATGGEIRFSHIAECEGGLGAHLCRAAQESTDYKSLCRAAATKKYTDARIRRALLYLLAGVTRADLAAPPAYLRLLGANERGREFLANGRKTRTVPVATKPAEIAALGERAARARALAAISDGLYALCLPGDVLPASLATVPPLMF